MKRYFLRTVFFFILSIGTGIPKSVAELSTELSGLTTIASQLKTEYEELLDQEDNGNTDLLISAIQSNMPAGNLKNLLLENSPLSDEVLLTLFAETNLPPGNFKNVMELNLPVSRETEPGFIVYLEALPPGIANQLRDLHGHNPFSETPTTIMREIEQNDIQRQYVIALIIQKMAEENMETQAIQLLTEEGTNDARCVIAGTYLNKADAINAADWINNVVPEAQEDIDWIEVNSVLLELVENGKSQFDISESQAQTIRDIAGKCPENLGISVARTLLRKVLNEEFEPCDPESELKNSEEAEQKFNTSENQNKDYLISAFPNPFTDHTQITYRLSGDRGAQVNIYNAVGEKVVNYSITDDSGIISVDAKTWPAGIYTCSIIADGSLLEIIKLVVIR